MGLPEELDIKMAPKKGYEYWRLIGYIPALIVAFLLLWSYYSFVIVFCAIQDSPMKSWKIFSLIFYHLFFLGTCTTYLQCMFSNPGVPPLAPEDQTITIEICDKCKRIKPERSHHCSLCQRCTLKMDHHCIWIYNCVGFRNYKFFVLFLTYIGFMGLVVVISMSSWIIDRFKSKESFVNIESGIQLIAHLLVAAIFGGGLFLFAVMHYRLILTNSTTIESMSMKRKIYKLDPYSNWTQVFGHNPLLWFLPVFTSLGDGMSFIKNSTENINLIESV